ncbi:SusC/RagA family TonB-linked outer membrane protein [Hoylesella nanceiensis]|uniref:SusC/RagA family TonB-linked outer membrane protein n=1 Tax=Hoylesella nanceiensis TaxID=425941 RepID=UPI0028E392BE|nr:SusC/RagA family TonB-linked outer membrane protein [Hoylesella nanceiensis]
MKMYTTPFSSSLHHRVAQLFIASAIMSIAPTPFFSQKTYAQTTAQSVSGTVIDKNNETLVGAIIKVLPNGDMTQTDAKGRFELKNLPANAKLQVSYLGMKTTTVSVDGKKELTILLENSDNNIGEVVVTGYQDVRRPRMTGSVSVIKSSDIAKMDVRSMDQVLRGTMSGVATTYNGRPGSDASIRIRGANSITGSTEPIWIVDGMPLNGIAPSVSNSNDLQRLVTQTGIGDIAPSDIESITVLKDAAATAIYGARAANGVIVVKTKNGREGKATYNASLYYGITERPYSNIRMMNSEEKIRFEREMFLDGEYDSVGRVAYLLNLVKNGAITQEEADKEISLLRSRNTNWFKELYRPANTQQVNLSLSGGSKRTQYYNSFTFLNQNGTELTNNYKRITFNSKLYHHFSDKLTLQTILAATYRNDRSTASVISPMRYAYQANPYEDPNGYDKSYDIRVSRLHPGLRWETLNMKREMLENQNTSRYLGLSLNVKLQWITPLEGLIYTSQASVSVSNTSSRREEGEGTYTNMRNNWEATYVQGNEIPAANVLGSLREGQYNTDAYTWRNMLSYNKTLGNDHSLEVMAGQEITSNVNYSSYNYSPQYDKVHRIVGFPQVPQGTDMSRFPFSWLGGTGKYESKMSSFFANATYSYADKYVVNASARYDGSDIIGNQNQFTPLWNVSGRWNIYKEPFMKWDFINFLSVRVGYGYTGSIDHNALPFVTMKLTETRPYAGLVVPTSYKNANPNIKWQTKKDFNIGLESSLWDNRITFNVNYYNNKVVDLLDNKSLPYSSGINSIKQNVANLVNRGWEFDLGFTPIRTKDFEWALRGNVSFNKNIITKTFYQEFKQVPQKSSLLSENDNVYIQGYSVGAWLGYDFAGIDPKTGHTLAYAEDGTKVDMDMFNNRTLALKRPPMHYLGEGNPTTTGGFATEFRYKQWELNAQFEFQTGHLIPTISSTMNHNYNYSGNRYIADQYRWRAVGDVAERPYLGINNTAYDQYRFNTSLEKGDYLRCTYTSLGYRLTEELCKKLSVRSARIAITASNLFTLTNFKGIDPASMGTLSYPSTRTYSITLNVGF